MPALAPHCARLGFGHLDLHAVVEDFWTTFEAADPDPDRHGDIAIEEPRWRQGPAALRTGLAASGQRASA